MRDAAGERPNALQTLRAQKLRFELLLLGDVGVDRQDGFGLPSASRTKVQCPSTITARPSLVMWRISPFHLPFSITISVASANCDKSSR